MSFRVSTGTRKEKSNKYSVFRSWGAQKGSLHVHSSKFVGLVAFLQVVFESIRMTRLAIGGRRPAQLNRIVGDLACCWRIGL